MQNEFGHVIDQVFPIFRSSSKVLFQIFTCKQTWYLLGKDDQNSFCTSKIMEKYITVVNFLSLSEGIHNPKRKKLGKTKEKLSYFVFTSLAIPA